MNGFNYYRLKLVDKDGRFTTYPVRIIKFEGAISNQLVISPNPISGREINLNVNGNTDSYIVNMYDQQGRLIFTQKIKMTIAGVKLYIPENINFGSYKLILQSDKKFLTQNIIIQ